MCQGGYRLRPDPPFVPGLESAGRIVATGPDVGAFDVGERVMAAHRPGGFAEETVVAERQLIKMPDAMEMTAAAGFLDPPLLRLITAWSRVAACKLVRRL